MKKFVFVLLAGLFLGACAQKTCPTYASVDLDTQTETAAEAV